MMRIYRVDQVRAIESFALSHRPTGALMARAAAAVADATETLLRDQPADIRVRVMAGSGNNGADALLAGLMLADRGFRVEAHAFAQRGDDAAHSAVRAAWRSRFGEPSPLPSDDAAQRQRNEPAVIIDGLVGIGLDRPPREDLARGIDWINHATAPVVAVDVPSGIDADRGCVPGEQAVRARVTVTLLAEKAGLRTGAALDHVGELRFDDLGVGERECDQALAAAPPSIDRKSGILLMGPELAERFSARPRDSHKGLFGDLLIAGGARGMQGALLLAASGAQALGAGKVHLSAPEAVVFDPHSPQWMSFDWDAPWPRADALVIGCGLGRSRQAVRWLAHALKQAIPLVVDADGLTLIADDRSLAAKLAARRGPEQGVATVLTPHPLEAARLLGVPTARIQADRVESARELARRHAAVVVLKGAGSVIADPAGRWVVLAAGHPILATAGTGDVLAGMVGALLAQGRPPLEAATLAALVHARAGDLAARRWPLGLGFASSELGQWVRRVVNRPSLH